MFSYFHQSYPKWKNMLDKVSLYEDSFKWNMLDEFTLIMELIIINIPVTSVEQDLSFIYLCSPLIPRLTRSMNGAPCSLQNSPNEPGL